MNSGPPKPNDPPLSPLSIPPGIEYEELRPPPIPDHELIRCIGQGSYGEVWLARNVMGTYRAVKIVHRRSFVDERPFDREYNGIQRFEPVSRSHESQVDILHIGRHNGCFFYVMELADDQDRGQEIDPDRYAPKNLRTVVERQGRLSADETLEIALALTTALEHLHSHGLVHRDIKPSNIIFVHGIPKLADIGLVTSADATRSFVGTEGFLPPEGPGTPRADIYSLGKVLYELCTGRDRKDYPDLPTLLDELEDRERLLELNAIIAKACREEAKDRYGSAEAMRQDLLLMQSGKSVRRMWALEKRLAFARKAGLVTGILLLLAGGAYGYQARQTRIVEQLAERNLELAQESQELADTSQRVTAESREQLVRLRVANGVRLMDQGNLSSSLLWFAEAMQLLEAGSDEEAIHRMRFEQVWSRLPRLHRMFRHDGQVNMSQFSPDGKWLVTASDDGTARVWDIEGDAPVSPPLPHGDRVESARFCRDGRLVLTAGSGNSARLWKASTGEEVGGPYEHEGPLFGAIFHPANDRVLTFGRDGKARLWEIATGDLLLEFGHDDWILACSFSPDGRWIATGDQDGVCRVWDMESGGMASETRVADIISSIHFDPTGESLFIGSGATSWSKAWGQRGRGTVIDPVRGEVLTRMVGHPEGITSSAISPDGTAVATGSQEEARLWRLQTGQQLVLPLDHRSLIRSVEFSPDGRWIVTACEDGTAGLFHALTGRTALPKIEQGAWVAHATFSPDGTKLATASDNHFAAVWLTTSTRAALNILSRETVPRFSISHNLMWSISNSNDIEITCLATRSRLGVVHFEGPIYFVYVLDGSRLLIVHYRDEANHRDGTRVFSLDTLEELAPLDDAADALLQRQFTHAVSVAGELAIRPGESNTLITISLVEGGIRIPELAFDSRILSFGFCHSGEKLSVGLEDGSGHVFDAGSGERLYSIRHEASVHHISFSPDNRWLLTTSGDQTGRIWDARTGQPRTPPFRHGGRVYGGGWSPDGTRVLTFGLSPHVHVWHVATGEPALPGLPLGEPMRGATFSPDGRFIASASVSGMARVWDAYTGEPLTPLLKLDRMIWNIQFNLSANTFYVVTGGGLWSWDLSDAELNLSARDYADLARLTSAQRLSTTGNIDLAKRDELWTIYCRLRTQHSPLFETNEQETFRWHRLQLGDSLREWDAIGATFHLNQLRERTVVPDAEALLARIRALEIPPRSSAAKPHSIDLGEFYNLPLTSGWQDIIGVHGYSDPEPGILPINGIGFDARGILLLRGELADQPSDPWPQPEPLLLPTRVDGISVHGRAKRLHFLHAVMFAYSPKGTKLGHYTIRYAGGLEVEFPFRQGLDTADWWDSSLLSDAESPLVGWEGYASLPDGQQSSVRLYLSTWTNPLPDREIESFDFVSAMERALPFLVAVTAEPPEELRHENESLEHGQSSRIRRGAETDERLVFANGQEDLSEVSW